MKRIIFFFLISIIFNTVLVMGQKTTISKTNGIWSSASTWTNNIPDPGKDSIVVNGDSINSASISKVTIGPQATLIIKNNATLVASKIEFSNGSKIRIESGSTLIATDLINKNNSVNVVINGEIILSGTLDNGNGGIITGTGSITATAFIGTGSTFGITTGSIGTTVISGSFLPVELLSFNIECQNDQKTIRWATASEINNNYFVIETSNDAQSFSELSRINGAGNSNNVLNYTFTTTEKFKYVRLVQVDFDGTKKIYDTHSTCENLKTEISVYPNPANSIVNIIGVKGQSKIEIYNTLGSIIFSLEGSNNTSVDMSNFTNGIYTIKIMNADGSINQHKLLKN